MKALTRRSTLVYSNSTSVAFQLPFSLTKYIWIRLIGTSWKPMRLRPTASLSAGHPKSPGNPNITTTWHRPSETETKSNVPSVPARESTEPTTYEPSFQIQHDAGRECATSLKTWWSSWGNFVLSWPKSGGFSSLSSLWGSTSATHCLWLEINSADPN